MPNKTNTEKNIMIGKMLQTARESCGLSQADMVEATGLSKNHISAIERGVSKASIEMLMAYCDKLKIKPNDILGYADSEVLPELAQKLEEIGINNQEKILDVIKIIFCND